MFDSKISGTAKAGLFTTASALALGLAFMMATPQQAMAETCVLDTDGDGDADNDGGATDSGDDFDNLACGNLANAGPDEGGDSFNTAIGTFSEATGGLDPFEGTPVGSNTAVGWDATATGGAAVAVGEDAEALGLGSMALGGDWEVNGEGTIATGNFAIAIGSETEAAGSGAIAIGGDWNLDSTGTSASGFLATAVGTEAIADGDESTAIGSFSVASEFDATAIGNEAVASGIESTALGAEALASATNATALGEESTASAENATAVGQSATASATDAVAIGQGATASAAGSLALGTGSFASLTDEFVFGTTANTYTAPGITSGQSVGRQSGLLEVVTSDADGHLATDGGDIFKKLAKVQAGVALAMSMQGPELSTDENFAMRLGYGNFEGDAHGIGLSMIGNFSNNANRWSWDAAVGAGWSDFYTYDSDTTWGGRAGLQVAW